MEKLSQQLLKDFLWLILSFTLTLLFAVLLFGAAFLKGQLGEQLPLFVLFFVVTSIVYVAKRVRIK